MSFRYKGSVASTVPAATVQRVRSAIHGTDIECATIRPQILLRDHTAKRGWFRNATPQMLCESSGADSSRTPRRGMRLLLVACALIQSLSCSAAIATVAEDQPAETIAIINNKPLRYGNYCGPGPGEVNPTQGCRMLPRLPAADNVDEGCLLHDQAYCNCRKSLESKGKPFPPAFFVVMAIRGELPEQFGSALLGVDRDFSMCVHEADRKLITDFQADSGVAVDVLRQQLHAFRPGARPLPSFAFAALSGADVGPRWDNTALAPRGAEGTRGFREACAFGVGKQCVLPSKTLFFRLKETFEKDLRLDGKAGLTGTSISASSSTP